MNQNEGKKSFRTRLWPKAITPSPSTSGTLGKAPWQYRLTVNVSHLMCDLTRRIHFTCSHVHQTQTRLEMAIKVTRDSRKGVAGCDDPWPGNTPACLTASSSNAICYVVYRLIGSLRKALHCIYSVKKTGLLLNRRSGLCFLIFKSFRARES